MKTKVVWRAQPGPQTALLDCGVRELLYGGARGGGKTDGMLGEWLTHVSRVGGAATGIFIRRELPQLDDAIRRSKELYTPVGAVYNEQKKTWTWPNGATLRFRALERDSDAEKYQGHSYTRIYFEELVNFPDEAPYFKMMATLRSSQTSDLGIRATANPGGPGHLWVKRRFIDPHPDGYRIVADDRSGLKRVFIPSKVKDNPALLEQNPEYVDQLKMVGSEALVRAWLDGDWNVVEGAFFDDWSEAKHVVEPFEVPQHWTLFGSLDWGSAAPASYGIWAISDGDLLPDGKYYPPGAMIRIAEDYMASGPNKGLKLSVEEMASRIMDCEGARYVSYRIADPAIFKQDGGPSQAERFARTGLAFRPGDNKRVQGWSQMRDRMRGNAEGTPMLYCFKTCLESRRIIPAMQHDKNRPEDIDTDGEDHIADEWRYACMSRPFVTHKPENKKPMQQKPWTVNELFKQHFDKVKQREW